MSICTVDGCDRAKLARGLCQVHYMRLRRLGTTDLPVKIIPEAECSVDGCSEQALRTGLCKLHYGRMYHRGTTDAPSPQGTGPDSHRWNGDDVSYHAVHIRLRVLRGRARDHLCEFCGKQAAEWGYDYAASTFMVDRKCRVYTTELDHYKPLCTRCHKDLDTARRRAIKAAA